MDQIFDYGQSLGPLEVVGVLGFFCIFLPSPQSNGA